jgi:hypothetical protein
MQPWFIKEGDVIPFTKKDDKVVKLPNVGAYPNFLTGVDDLQSRVKQGTLSDEMYKKLYTELLHRFMRRESAETPWFLRENKEQQLDQKLDKLVDIAKKDPNAQNIVGSFLDKIVNYGKNLLGNKQKSPVQEQPIQGTQTLDQKLANAHLVFDLLKKELGPESNPIFDKILQATDKLSIQPDIAKLIKGIKQQEFKKGKEQGTAELNDFLKTYDQAINNLTNKITSSEQAFVDANSDAQTKTLQKDVSTKQNTIAVIKQVISSIFTGKLFQPGTISDQALRKKLIDFLQQAKEGIVDWGKILRAGKGKKASVESFVPPEFREVFDLFKKQLFSARPPTTAGAWGPGEVGLILLGNPITKAGDGGDLQDVKTGDKFELKGSNNPRKGGRLSPPGLSTSKMNDVFKKIKNKHIGEKNLRKLGPNSSINKSSFNQSFIKEYNEIVDKIKIKTKQFLTDVIKGAFLDTVPTDKELSPYVDEMIVGNKINADSFLKNYTKFLFNRYQGAGKDQKFKNIIVFNPRSTTYTVIASAGDLDSKDLLLTGGIDFGGAQVPKSPQIGIA